MCIRDRYNPILAREYFECYARISEDLGIENDVRTSYIMRSPDVITIDNEADDEEIIKSLVIKAIDGAAERLVETRIAEGERLKTDLIKKLDGMVLNVQFITEKSPIIVEEYKEKITTRIHELLEETTIDEARIAQEVDVYKRQG